MCVISERRKVVPKKFPSGFILRKHFPRYVRSFCTSSSSLFLWQIHIKLKIFSIAKKQLSKSGCVCVSKCVTPHAWNSIFSLWEKVSSTPELNLLLLVVLLIVRECVSECVSVYISYNFTLISIKCTQHIIWKAGAYDVFVLSLCVFVCVLVHEKISFFSPSYSSFDIFLQLFFLLQSSSHLLAENCFCYDSTVYVIFIICCDSICWELDSFLKAIHAKDERRKAGERKSVLDCNELDKVCTK